MFRSSLRRFVLCNRVPVSAKGLRIFVYVCVIADLFGIPSAAIAATCPTAAPTTLGPFSLTANHELVHDITVLPCQTVSVTLTGSASDSAWGDASMAITIRTGAPNYTGLSTKNFTCSVSCTVTLPETGAVNGSPTPGTRGVEGLAAQVVVSVGTFSFF